MVTKVFKMKLARLYLLFAIALLLLIGEATLGVSFDARWKFMKGDAPGAEQPGFDDSQWRQLDLPHDWSIEGPFAQTNKTGGAGAWLPHGVGWYRSSFRWVSDSQGKRFAIEFDGVMQNSEVWINGVSLGKRPFGYASFSHDLTPHLKFGKGATNVIAVRADTSAQPASRWYSGAGIYRHVRLLVADSVHLEPHASFVTTPVIQSNSATIHIETRIINDSKETKELKVLATIFGPPNSAPDGCYAVASEADAARISVAPGKSAAVKFDVRIPWSPWLWSLEKPDRSRVVLVVPWPDCFRFAEVSLIRRRPFGRKPCA